LIVTMAGVEGRPIVSRELVPSLVERFGLPSDGLEIKEMPSYEDLNFRVQTASGSRYVLKVHNSTLASGTRQRLEAQNRVIARLKERGLPVPEVIADSSGEPIFPLDPSAASSPLVRMLSYLEGDIVPNETPKDAAFLQGIGELVGRVATALADFDDPEAKWTWDWDMRHVARVVREKLSFIADEDQRALAARLADEYEAMLGVEGALVADLPHSVLHADMNDTNLLFDGSSVVGIIDFGDSIYGCTVFDLAIAAGYYSLGQANPMMVFCEVLRGYLRTAPRQLSDAEIAAFFQVARGRVLLSVAFSAQSCSLEPDNEYLAHTSKPGWAVLQILGAMPTERALETLTAVAKAVGVSATSADA